MFSLKSHIKFDINMLLQFIMFWKWIIIELHILFSDDFLLNYFMYFMLFLIERSFYFFNYLMILFISFKFKFIFFDKLYITASYMNLSIFTIMHKYFTQVSLILNIIMFSIFMFIIDKSSLRRIYACKI